MGLELTEVPGPPLPLSQNQGSKGYDFRYFGGPAVDFWYQVVGSWSI